MEASCILHHCQGPAQGEGKRAREEPTKKLGWDRALLPKSRVVNLSLSPAGAAGVGEEELGRKGSSILGAGLCAQHGECSFEQKSCAGWLKAPEPQHLLFQHSGWEETQHRGWAGALLHFYTSAPGTEILPCQLTAASCLSRQDEAPAWHTGHCGTPAPASQHILDGAAGCHSTSQHTEPCLVLEAEASFPLHSP